MQTVIPLKIENGWVSLEQNMLPKIWLNEPIEAIVKNYGILIKPISLSDRTRGIVERHLSYDELEQRYGER